jgi:hypothetical protein
VNKASKRHASGSAAANGSRLVTLLMTEDLHVSHFRDQIRRRTQLTGLIKVFFTTDIRKSVTL